MQVNNERAEIKKKVVFFMPRCYHYHVRAVHKQARSLHEAGYDVLLVVRQATVSEYLGMQVVEVNTRWGTAIRSLLNLPAWYRQCLSFDADLIIVRNPDTLLLALVLISTGHKVIYDSHEDFSKRPMIRDIRPAILRPLTARLITFFERLLARYAAAVIVTQAQQVSALGGRTYLQPNAPLTSGPVFDDAERLRRRPDPQQLEMIYVGAITEDRGIWQMLELAEAVNAELPCRLSLVGWFISAELEADARSHAGWRYVDFARSVSHAEALARISSADIALALLHPVADYPTTSVTKLFEYMQFGIPFVASDFAAWRVSTRDGEAGLYVDPASVADCAAACLSLLRDEKLRSTLGERGAKYVALEFNWELFLPEFLDIVEGAVAAGAGRDGG